MNPATLAASGRASPLAAVTVMLVSGAFALGGCGGAAGHGTGANTNGASPRGASLVEFAQCMRTHGLPSFPDPTGGTISLGPSANGSPAYRGAFDACKSRLPGGGQSAGQLSVSSRAQALRFASCMRTHGVPSYADPNTAGALQPSPDKGTPQFRSATQACRSLFPEHISVTPGSQ